MTDDDDVFKIIDYNEHRAYISSYVLQLKKAGNHPSCNGGFAVCASVCACACVCVCVCVFVHACLCVCLCV